MVRRALSTSSKSQAARGPAKIKSSNDADSAKPAGAAKRKARRYRPGTVAMREIRKFQKGTQLLIAKSPFARLCRETLQDYSTWPYKNGALRLSPGAIEALQQVSEAFLIEVFQEANVSAIKDDRVTILPEDIRMYLRMKFGASSEFETDVFKAMELRKLMERHRAERRGYQAAKSDDSENEIILSGVPKPVRSPFIIRGEKKRKSAAKKDAKLKAAADASSSVISPVPITATTTGGKSSHSGAGSSTVSKPMKKRPVASTDPEPAKAASSQPQSTRVTIPRKLPHDSIGQSTSDNEDEDASGGEYDEQEYDEDEEMASQEE